VKKIFICYRRANTEYAAGALGRDLRAHFGEGQVFRDKEDVGAGVSWKQQVAHEIDGDSALLVLIGKGWADVLDDGGHRRLESAEDAVRLEIEEGIRESATMIPVLLENAQMPAAGQLPEAIKPLADLNARPLRDGDWQYDLGRICAALEEVGFKPAAPPSPAPAAGALTGKRSLLATVSMSLSLVIGLMSLLGFAASARDQSTQVGFCMVSLVALLLALPATRDDRRTKRAKRWDSVGAVIVGAGGFVVHLALAIFAGDAPPAPAVAAPVAAPAKPDPSPPPAKTNPEAEPGKSEIAGKWAGTAHSNADGKFTVALTVIPSCALGKNCGTIALSSTPCYGRTSLKQRRGDEYEFSIDGFNAGSAGKCRPGAGEHFRLNPDQTLFYHSDSGAKGILHRMKRE
jgi:TIR domain